MSNTFQSYLPFYKRNLKIAVPIMLSQLGQGVVVLFDNIMVGQLGTNELAAVSFANSIVVLALVFITGVSFGATPLIGQSYAMKQFRKVGEFLQNSTLFITILGLALVALFLVLTCFMDRMGQTPEVSSLALDYTRIVILSLIPFLFFCILKQFMEGVGNTRIAMNITIIANVINIVFNYLLIYGKFGFPFMGVAGAGVATLISRILMPILFMMAIWRNTHFKRYFYFFSMKRFNKQSVSELVRIGFPIGGQMLIEVSAFAFSSIMMGWMGAVALASHQIALNISHLTFMAVVGIASATTIRVSHQLGERNPIGLRKAGIASLHLGLLTNFITAVVLILCRKYIAMAFSEDPQVIELASMLIILAGIFQFSDGLQVVSLGALRGLHDVKKPMYYAFISYLVINLPVGYLLAFKLGFGPAGIWCGFIFGLSVAAVLYLRRFNHFSNRLIQNGVK
ncbi:MAG: MATE family efflux transporter [Tannerellaceae bacterium]